MNTYLVTIGQSNTTHRVEANSPKEALTRLIKNKADKPLSGIVSADCVNHVIAMCNSYNGANNDLAIATVASNSKINFYMVIFNKDIQKQVVSIIKELHRKGLIDAWRPHNGEYILITRFSNGSVGTLLSVDESGVIYINRYFEEYGELAFKHPTYANNVNTTLTPDRVDKLPDLLKYWGLIRKTPGANRR